MYFLSQCQLIRPCYGMRVFPACEIECRLFEVSRGQRGEKGATRGEYDGAGLHALARDVRGIEVFLSGISSRSHQNRFSQRTEDEEKI